MNSEKKRLELIDTARGITIISMILFHTCWFMNYFGMLITSEMLFGRGFTIWERTICCSFIFISGFSFSLGKRHLRNGLLILSLGVAITILSVLFAYDVRDIFGVLWLLGLSVLLMMPLVKVFKLENISKQTATGLFFAFLLIFVYLWNINFGYIGFKNYLYLELPGFLYNGLFMTLLGFTKRGFYSVDYFSLLPWFFLYMTGFFFHKIVRNTKFESDVLTRGLPILKWMGRHSLIIYLIHPVVIFISLYIISIF